MEIPTDIIYCLIFLALLPVVFGLLCFLEFYMTKRDGPIIIRSHKEKYYHDPQSKENKLFSALTRDDPGTVRLSVVVPAYNEETRLPVMLDEAIEYLSERETNDGTFTYEIIIVDDGSSDRTSEVGLKYSSKLGCDKIRVLTLETNRGKGGAIRLGVLSARGELILMADADGATRFSDLSKLESALEPLLDHKDEVKQLVSGVAIGSRAHLERDSIAQRSMFRTFLMKGFHWCVYFLGNIRGLKDTQCGFKLFTRPAAYYTFSNLHVERWAFDVELLYIAQELGIPVVEVSVNWQEIEGSKLVPFWSWVQMGRDLFSIRVHYLLLAWKVVHRPPRQPGDRPGQSGDRQGQPGDRPRQTGDSPGQTGDRQGQLGDKQGVQTSEDKKIS